MAKATLLPEWYPVKSVMLAWPYPEGDWKANYEQIVECYWSILQQLSTRVTVWLLHHSKLDVNEFESGIQKRRIAREKLVVHVCDYDDTWIRDFGPLSTSEGYVKFQFNGWGGKYAADNDNRVILQFFEKHGYRLREIPFVCEGGALESNGSLLLMNSNCVVDENRNPGLRLAEVEITLLQELGADSALWLDDICLTGDDTDGHIDTIVRFVGEKGLIYCAPNGGHPDNQILVELENQVIRLADQYGFDLWALPTPQYRSLIDQRLLPCTYANFLICNQTVFAPIYGLAEDEKALHTLTCAFPDFEIVPIRCEALLEQHGSLHCATMQIAEIPHK